MLDQAESSHESKMAAKWSPSPTFSRIDETIHFTTGATLLPNKLTVSYKTAEQNAQIIWTAEFQTAY